MESQVQAQVLGVTSRQSRNGQHTMYDVALSDGNKYTTFDPDLAGKAASLQGQQVAANVSIEQKPGNGGRMFTNFNLLDIGQVGALAPPPAGQVAIPNAQVAQPVAIPGVQPTAGVITPAPSSGGGGGMSDADKARITRLSAAGTAFDFVSRLFAGAGPEAGEQALSIARAVTESLVGYGQQGVWPGIAPSPAQVAAAVPGVQVGVEGIQQEQAAPATEPTTAQAAQGSDIPWND